MAENAASPSDSPSPSAQLLPPAAETDRKMACGSLSENGLVGGHKRFHFARYSDSVAQHRRQLRHLGARIIAVFVGRQVTNHESRSFHDFFEDPL